MTLSLYIYFLVLKKKLLILLTFVNGLVVKSKNFYL